MIAASYRGLNPDTGRLLADDAHIARCIRDILTTPVGTRVMRRDYGSLIPDLIDQPMNGATLLRFASAAYMALLRWEPRIRITTLRFAPDANAPGSLVAELAAVRTDQPTAPGLQLNVPLWTGGADIDTSQWLTRSVTPPPPEALLDEDREPLLDEDGEPIYQE